MHNYLPEKNLWIERPHHPWKRFVLNFAMVYCMSGCLQNVVPSVKIVAIMIQLKLYLFFMYVACITLAILTISCNTLFYVLLTITWKLLLGQEFVLPLLQDLRIYSNKNYGQKYSMAWRPAVLKAFTHWDVVSEGRQSVFFFQPSEVYTILIEDDWRAII